MKFLYDKNVDHICHQRLQASDRIFNELKKTGTYDVTPKIIQVFSKAWTHNVDLVFRSGMEKIFQASFPEQITCFINSTPYSMDTPDGISVSASTQTPIRAICHEANHYLFRRSNFHNIYFSNQDIEDAKEIFVIVNNIYFRDIMETQDIGWKIFWKDRYSFLERWIRERCRQVNQ